LLLVVNGMPPVAVCFGGLPVGGLLSCRHGFNVGQAGGSVLVADLEGDVRVLGAADFLRESNACDRPDALSRCGAVREVNDGFYAGAFFEGLLECVNVLVRVEFHALTSIGRISGFAPGVKWLREEAVREKRSGAEEKAGEQVMHEDSLQDGFLVHPSDFYRVKVRLGALVSGVRACV